QFSKGDVYSSDVANMIQSSLRGDKDKKNYVDQLLKMSQDMLTQMTTLQKQYLTSENNNANANANKAALCTNEWIPHEMMPYIIFYLLDISCNQYLQVEYCDKILSHLTEYLKQLQVPSQTNWNSNSNSNSSSKDLQLPPCMDRPFQVLKSLLKHLGHLAISNSSDQWAVLEKIRYHFARHLLFGEWSSFLPLQQIVIRCLVSLSGLKSAFDQVNDKRLNELKTKFEQTVTEYVRRPLVDALKSKQVTSKNKMLAKALQGLSLVLQSNYKLGCDIVANEEVLNCVIEVVSSEEKSNSDSTNIDNNNNNNNNKSKKSPYQELKYLGIEVLALSCSHQPIRKAVMDSGNTHLFAWILDCPNLLVRAHAANALAKFASIDDDARELALGGNNRGLQVVMAIIADLLHDEKFSDSKSPGKLDLSSSSSSSSILDYDDYDDRMLANKKKIMKSPKEKEEEEEFETFKVPLMNLCIECISYLTLQVEIKLAMVENDDTLLKVLFSLSKTRYFLRNRALRHGLLTVILNCSLSKHDADKALSQKEKQIHKLKKVVAKGLPNNPLKEDEMIHSHAGEDEQISMVQEHLVACNCVYLMYEIIRSTQKENKQIDEYLNEELDDQKKESSTSGGGDSNQTGGGNSASERHKQLQRIKYKPIELESKLQMKIAQVLAMFADANEFRSRADRKKLTQLRGQLIQQNAVRLLLDLFSANSPKDNRNLSEDCEKIRLMSGTALARIGVLLFIYLFLFKIISISIDPRLFNSSHLKPMIVVLLYLIHHSQHELQEYEGLLALCNISSLSEEMREYIMDLQGWSVLRDAFEQSNPQINAAVLECWCNLCTCEKGLLNLKRNSDCDIKIVTVFLRDASLRVLTAVTNILAMASCDEDLCKSIAKFGGVFSLHVVSRNLREALTVLTQHTSYASDKDNAKTKEEQIEIAKHRSILSNVDMTIKNLEHAGFSLTNVYAHGIDQEIMDELQKTAEEDTDDDENDKQGRTNQKDSDDDNERQ
ncbi:hypothetical protein RFI_10613, partial [Reticulomyxa filosa]